MSEQSNEGDDVQFICPFYHSCILPKNYNCNNFRAVNICSEYQLKKKNMNSK
jgi:hypothetical protein